MIAARAETRFLPGVLIPGLLAAQLVTTAFAQTTPSQRTAGSRPNILWITCEDMSPDLGCYGDSYARTPTLDNLAAGHVVNHIKVPEHEAGPAKLALERMLAVS